MHEQKFDLRDFVPEKIFVGADGKTLPLHIREDNQYLYLSYTRPTYNGGTREYSHTIKRYISQSKETFEVLGLLQAEMGKTQNGCIAFCNHEVLIMKKVLAWFKRELEIYPNEWRWYIKVNINEPSDDEYSKYVESKVLSFWLEKTTITSEMRYPKSVSYIKNTENTKLRISDYGTLIIEHKRNVLSQVIKQFVHQLSYRMPSFEVSQIREFMRGIIAGEGCVAINIPFRKYCVHVSATKEEERAIYQQCLARLGITCFNYPANKDLIISRKENLLQLLKQNMLCLSPKKYARFLSIFKLYDEFPEYRQWKQRQTAPHNKIPDTTIRRILVIYRQNPDWPAWRIAEQTGVSAIKVQRVLKEHNLGKRVMKTVEAKRQEIARFAEAHPELSQQKIADHFAVSESVVTRALQKCGVRRGSKANCKIPEEKIQRILQMYRENPAVKVSDICTVVGVSDSVVKRVRREHRLTHLGYRHLVGNNNRIVRNTMVEIESITVEVPQAESPQ